MHEKNLKEALKILALENELELFGVLALTPQELAFKSYKTWLAQEMHAGMHFMEKYQDLRSDPRKLLQDAKSALVFGFYYAQEDSLSELKNSKGVIAQYARFSDYHKVLRVKLENFCHKLANVIHVPFKYRIVVDTAPLFEKILASQTTFGFIGKNTLFIHPNKGSFFVLGEVLLDIDFSLEEKIFVDPKVRSSSVGGCGTCARCQTHCPTGALDLEYTLDSRRCISYYSIEHRGIIPIQYWNALKNYIFGCDICQIVCPYNRGKTKAHLTPKLARTFDLVKVALMGQKEYEEMFQSTPVTRAKKDGLKRNALIALVVNKHPELQRVVEQLKNENSQLLNATIAQIDEFRNAYQQQF